MHNSFSMMGKKPRTDRVPAGAGSLRPERVREGANGPHASCRLRLPPAAGDKTEAYSASASGLCGPRVRRLTETQRRTCYLEAPRPVAAGSSLNDEYIPSGNVRDLEKQPGIFRILNLGTE